MPSELEANTALVVIDVQQGFDDANFGPRNNPACETNISALLAHWTATGRPVVAVRHDALSPGSPLAAASAGNAFKEFVTQYPHDLLVSKHVNSAFYGDPDLDAWLKTRHIRQLVICGIQTNMCAETTARMAGNLGYDAIFAIDATHTFDLTGPDGDVLPAEQLAHNTAANLHGGGFAEITHTPDILVLPGLTNSTAARVGIA